MSIIKPSRTFQSAIRAKRAENPKRKCDNKHTHTHTEREPSLNFETDALPVLGTMQACAHVMHNTFDYQCKRHNHKHHFNSNKKKIQKLQANAPFFSFKQTIEP